jgi:hypothetical protein
MNTIRQNTHKPTITTMRRKAPMASRRHRPTPSINLFDV